jgi:WD40 repeat protein
MYQWNIDGSILHQWSGFRIMDVAISSDGKLLYACSDKKIKIFNLIDKSEIDCIFETESVTSMFLSRDGTHLLVNLSISEIHLWSLKEKKIVNKYFGQKQGRFVIRSTIGGLNENFILSGSEGFIF